jgi:hypothetical protein
MARSIVKKKEKTSFDKYSNAVKYREVFLKKSAMSKNISWVEILPLSEMFLGKPQLPHGLFHPEVRIWIDRMKDYIPPEYTQESIFWAFVNSGKRLWWQLVDIVHMIICFEWMRETENMSRWIQESEL